MDSGVSIIISNYNKGRLPLACLDSVAAQVDRTLAPIEVIFVDDGSTDPASIEAIEEIEYKLENGDYPFRLTFIRQENGGQSVARNTAISHAQFPFCMNLDSDDELDKDWMNIEGVGSYLDEAIFAFRDDENLALFYSIARFTGSEAGFTTIYDHPIVDILSTNPIPGFAIFKTEDARAVGGYPTHLRKLEDWLFWSKLMNHHLNSGKRLRLKASDYPYYNYHKDDTGENVSSRRDVTRSNILKEMRETCPTLVAFAKDMGRGRYLWNSAAAGMGFTADFGAETSVWKKLSKKVKRNLRHAVTRTFGKRNP